VNVAIGEVMSY